MGLVSSQAQLSGDDVALMQVGVASAAAAVLRNPTVSAVVRAKAVVEQASELLLHVGWQFALRLGIVS